MTNPEQDAIRSRQENARLFKKAAVHLQKINKFLLEKDPQSTDEPPEVATWVLAASNTELSELQRLQSELKTDNDYIMMDSQPN